MQSDKYKEASDAFKEAIAIDPKTYSEKYSSIVEELKQMDELSVHEAGSESSIDNDEHSDL